MSPLNTLGSGEKDPSYARDFGARVMERTVQIMKMDQKGLVNAWEACVRNAITAKLTVDDELSKAASANVSTNKFIS